MADTSWIKRLLHPSKHPQNREQLVELLRSAKEHNLLDAQSLIMIEGVLHVSELRVRDIIIPRAQMIVVESKMSLREIISIVIESGHSRFPIVGESRDEIMGIMLAKDLLRAFFADQGNFKVDDVMRPAVFVPESKRLDILLREFRISHNHMAIVLDEYNGVAGLVTIEDVLERIVGEIEDEYDIEEEFIKKINENSYVVRAITPIEDFNEYFNTKFSDEEFDTIGGLVMSQFGYLPKRGDKINLAQYEMKVLHADRRRIRLLQVDQLS